MDDALSTMESMTGLLLTLTPIVIADMVNPVLLGGAIYSLGSRHPIINCCAVLLSYFITYFLAGLIIAVFLESIMEFLHIPPTLDYVLELCVAALLLYFAYKQYKEGDQHPERQLKKDKGMTLYDAAAMGVQINLVGLPLAVPYLAAIDQVLKADLSVPASFIVLLIYNIVYILPFAALILLRLIYKNESEGMFKSINQWMHRVCVRYMPLLFVILAILLLEDAVSWLLGYREYSFLSLFLAK